MVGVLYTPFQVAIVHYTIIITIYIIIIIFIGI